MKTLRFKVDPARLQTHQAQDALERCAQLLRDGGLVALPTETVYGLGANALDAAAVARIFEAKQRPAWDPIIVHIAGPVPANPMLRDLVTGVPEPARKLMQAFWPGPLTLLLPRSPSVPDAVTAGRPLVGIRMPAHPAAHQLILRAGVPVAAPSANLFSHTSPTTADHVLDDLDGRIDAILDAGPCLHGLESTVLDPTQSPMVIYRPGAITLEQIQAIAGEVELFAPATQSAAPPEALPSPGVGIRHYAPKAHVMLVEPADLADACRQMVKTHGDGNVGVMMAAELDWSGMTGCVVFDWGHWNAHDELAHRLYAGLRDLDSRGVAVIICPLPHANGVGAALRDRLGKAAR